MKFIKRSLGDKYGWLGAIIGVALVVAFVLFRFLIVNNDGDLEFWLSDILFLLFPILFYLAGRFLTTQLKKKDQLLEEHRAELNRQVTDISKALRQLNDTDQGLDFETLNLNEENKAALRVFQEGMGKRRLEEERRTWVSEGIARFSEILRNDVNNSHSLYHQIISNLVKYLDANQGGLFLVSDDNDKVVLELGACYAYDRKKFINQSIKPGEGLIGQAYLEKERILLADVPEDYINITSGLGKATPKNLVLFPLKMEDKVMGILELASFNSFEEHHFELLERIGEMTASTISGIQVSEHTSKLLEDSQVQTEQLRAQEEEMRQNMEELAATQEDTKRKEQELQKILAELKSKEIIQRLSEISVSIESIMENSRKELLFLQSTPPISGIFRAQDNGGVDPMDGSTKEIWISRLNVIMENLMTSKKLYGGVLLIDTSNTLITGLTYDRHSILPIESYEAPKNIQDRLTEGQVYTANPIVDKQFYFVVHMYLPIFFTGERRGYMLLTTLGDSIIRVIEANENEDNRYALRDGRENDLYLSSGYSESDLNERKKVTLDDADQFSMNIIHSSE